MSADDKEAVGYRQPPKRTQWKKGQSGNPGGKKRAKKLSRTIKEIFAKEIDLVENENKKRVTVFEAILRQLWRKQSQGSRRAMRVLKKYEAFAKTKPTYFMMPDQSEKELAEAYERSFVGEGPRDTSWDHLTPSEAEARYEASFSQEADDD